MAFLVSVTELPALRANTSISIVRPANGAVPSHTNFGAGLHSRTTELSRRHWY